MLVKEIPRNFPAVLLFFACLFISASGAQGKDVVGIVTSVSGTWLADGVKIYRGQKLPAGALIKAKEPNPKYSRLVIMLLDHSEVSRICDREGFCGEPLKLPDEVKPLGNKGENSRTRAYPAPPSFWERLVTAMNSFRASRRRYRKTFARGEGDIVTRDEVIILDRGRLDLKPVLMDCEPQAFLVRVEVAEKVEENGWRKVAEGLPLDWGGKGKAVVSVPAMKPGLYLITFSPAEDAKSSAAKDAWVLVVEPSSYRKVSSQYRRAVALTMNWDRRTDPTPETFLRAFLETLAVEENLLRGAESQ